MYIVHVVILWRKCGWICAYMGFSESGATWRTYTCVHLCMLCVVQARSSTLRPCTMPAWSPLTACLWPPSWTSSFCVSTEAYLPRSSPWKTSRMWDWAAELWLSQSLCSVVLLRLGRRTVAVSISVRSVILLRLSCRTVAVSVFVCSVVYHTEAVWDWATELWGPTCVCVLELSSVWCISDLEW